MGLIGRTFRVIRAKFNKLLSTQEDPLEQLEMTYQDMRDERRSMKQSIVNVKAQRKSLERKIDRFEEEVEEHNSQARAAMEQGEEQLARKALEQKKAKMTAVEDLRSQVEEIENVEDDMYDKLDEIDNRISELKTEKEILKARYEGAEAMEDVNASLSEGMGDYSVEENVEDIKTEITEMQSRAEAVQEFEDEREEQDVDSQLDQMQSDSEVEAEMESLRAELGTGDDVEVEQSESETEEEVSLEKELA
jgi:phage shock protein A